MSALPQGDGVSTFFGVGHELLKNPLPVSVRITYENVKGHQTSKDIVLDVRQFDGFCSVGTRPEDDIADSLKKIERCLDRLGSNSQRLHVVAASPDDWQERDDLVRQRREEHFRQLRDASAKVND